MDRYRIGRVSGTWFNFTLLIRGGKFAGTTNEAFPTILDNSSIHAEALSKFYNPNNSTSRSKALANPSCWPHHDVLSGTSNAPQVSLSKPDNAKVVKQALEDGMELFPRLETKTQQAIIQKYRHLHDRIKNEGYYTCRYGDYAKEVAIYLGVFALFIITLRAGWYMTSAALLRLFWVWHVGGRPMLSR